MSEASTQSEKSSALTWALSILSALLLYVLSVGPIGYLVEKRILPNPAPAALAYFYLPVWLLGTFTPLGKPIDAYVNWWVHLARRP